MAYSVFVVDTVARVVASLNKVDRRAYDTAISGLKGEGCQAAGYRLAATDGGDFPMCCRHLAGDWRMHTLFAKDRSVIVISLARQGGGQIAGVSSVAGVCGLAGRCCACSRPRG